MPNKVKLPEIMQDAVSSLTEEEAKMALYALCLMNLRPWMDGDIEGLDVFSPQALQSRMEEDGWARKKSTPKMIYMEKPSGRHRYNGAEIVHSEKLPRLTAKRYGQEVAKHIYGTGDSSLAWEVARAARHETRIRREEGIQNPFQKEEE